MNLGFCLLKAGQAERAGVCFERATELAPKDQAAFLGLAQAYRAQGRVKEADAAYRAVRNIDEFSDLGEEAERGLAARKPAAHFPKAFVSVNSAFVRNRVPSPLIITGISKVALPTS